MGRVFLIVIVLGAQVFLAACSTVLPETSVAAHSDNAVAVDDAGDALPTNPYLQQRRRVPAAAERRFESAVGDAAEERWAAAVEQLQWLVQNYPQLSGPYLNLALIYQHTGQWVLAEEYYHAALEVNALNLSAYNQYGIFLREQGRFHEAEAAYLAALEVWDAHPDTHRNLGVLYDLYLGKREQALQHFQRYQSLSGKDDRMVAGWIVDLQRQLTMEVRGS